MLIKYFICMLIKTHFKMSETIRNYYRPNRQTKSNDVRSDWPRIWRARSKKSLSLIVYLSSCLSLPLSLSLSDSLSVCLCLDLSRSVSLYLSLSVFISFPADSEAISWPSVCIGNQFHIICFSDDSSEFIVCFFRNLDRIPI